MTAVGRTSAAARLAKPGPTASYASFKPEQGRYIGRKSIRSELVGQVGGKRVVLEVHPQSFWSMGSSPAMVTVEPADSYGKLRNQLGKKLTQAQVRDLLKGLERAGTDPSVKPQLRSLVRGIAQDIRDEVPH